MAEDTRTRQFTLTRAAVTQGTGVPLLLPRGVPGRPARTLMPLSGPLHPLSAVRGTTESAALSLAHERMEALSKPRRQVEGSTCQQ